MSAAFRPAGGGFATEHLASTGLSPRVALDAAGAGIALWLGDGQIRAAFRAAGGSFGSAAPISVASAGQTVSAPELAVDDAGGAVALWLRTDGAETVVQAAFRPAGGAFGPPQTISAAGQQASAPRVALDRHGNAIAVWQRSDGANRRIEAALRPAGGAFAPAAAISAAGQDAVLPQIAFDGAGNALAAWLRSDGANWRAQAAFRPADGAFAPAQTLSEAGQDASTVAVAFGPQGDALATWELHFWIQAAARPAGGSFGTPVRVSPIDHNAIGAQLGFDPAGNALALWWDQDLAGTHAAAAVRPAGAGSGFGAPQTLSAAGVEQLTPRLAIDGQGNAVAVWLRRDGAGFRVEAAGYDATPPVLRTVVFPAGGVAGAALTFAAEPFDVWGPVTTTWAFGDGGGASGAQVAHAYGAPGAFDARVTATDAAGNAVTAAQAVAVAPQAGGGPPGGGPPGGGAQQPGGAVPGPPKLSKVKLSPRRFRAAAHGATVARAARAGTAISYRLSEPARVRFTVERATTGRRGAGRSCRRATRRTRHRPSCRRYVAVRGAFAHSGRTGRNALRFTGRLRGRPLASGRYRLLVRAVDAQGERSQRRVSPFRIVRPRHRPAAARSPRTHRAAAAP